MKHSKKPLASLVGATFLAAAMPALSSSNPFTANPLSSGYDLVSRAKTDAKDAEGKCGASGKGECVGECKDMKKCEAEGKCGEGKCGEGKCGDEKKCETGKSKLDATAPAAKADEKAKGEKAEEGKCGEGMCGGM
jgi:uncharacterized low-complexity protein